MVKIQSLFQGKSTLLLAVGTANLVAVTTGMMLGWSSPILAKLRVTDENNPLSEAISSNEEAWLASVFPLGSVMAPFLFAFLQDFIGRKFSLMIIIVIDLVSYLILAFAKVIGLFYFARLAGGMSAAAMFVVLPTYLAEISPTALRGMLGASMICFQSFGMLASYILGPYLSMVLFNLLEAIIPLICLILLYFIPESPYYLIAKNRKYDAGNVLMYLRSKNIVDVQKDLQEIENVVINSINSKGKLLDIFKSRGYTKAFVISMSLVTLPQLCGINIVMFYTQNIFNAAFVSMDSAIPPIILGVVQFVGSFVTPSLVDRLGRKILLLVSSIGIAVSLVILGIYFHLQRIDVDVAAISWIPIVTLVTFIVAYNAGIGTLCWTIMAEILPSNLKVTVAPMAATSSFLVGFALSFSYNSISEAIGMGGAFWICTGFSTLAFLFSLLYVPETKGKSFQDIQDILNS